MDLWVGLAAVGVGLGAAFEFWFLDSMICRRARAWAAVRLVGVVVFGWGTGAAISHDERVATRYSNSEVR